MDIETTKKELIKTILDLEDKEMIQRISAFVAREKEDFWNELSLAQQQEMEKGIRELDEGKRISFDSF